MAGKGVVDFNVYVKKNIDLETIKKRLEAEEILTGFTSEFLGLVHCTTSPTIYETLFSQCLEQHPEESYYFADKKLTIPSHLQDIINDVVLEEVGISPYA